MIPRYTRPKIEKIWSTKNKFAIWTDIECLIAEKLSINGIIPKKYIDLSVTVNALNKPNTKKYLFHILLVFL